MLAELAGVGEIVRRVLAGVELATRLPVHIGVW